MGEEHCEILPLTVLKITLLGRPLFQLQLGGDAGLKVRVKESPVVIAGRESAAQEQTTGKC